MKIVERIVMVLLLISFVGGGIFIYLAVQNERQEIKDAVARGEYKQPQNNNIEIAPDEWRSIYPNTVMITIGSTTVEASVADTLSERIKGLSSTPFLPTEVVKLFVFGVSGSHSIWMKDMNYSIDIIWVDESGNIVHMEENISPETYPESFSSPVPAWYVIEASAGFVDSNSIMMGDRVMILN